jgi:hypothetical protein
MLGRKLTLEQARIRRYTPECAAPIFANPRQRIVNNLREFDSSRQLLRVLAQWDHERVC